MKLLAAHNRFSGFPDVPRKVPVLLAHVRKKTGPLHAFIFLWQCEKVTTRLLLSLCLVVAVAGVFLVLSKPEQSAEVQAAAFRQSQGEGVVVARLPVRKAFPARWKMPVRVWVQGRAMPFTQSLTEIRSVTGPASCLKGERLLYLNTDLFEQMRTTGGGRLIVAYDTRLRYLYIINLAAAAILLLALVELLRAVKPPPGSAEASSGSRLHALDSLRGVAAFIVFVSHLPHVFTDINWFQTSYVDGVRVPVSPFWEALKYSPLSMLVNGPLMVHVFWVLSGLVLARPHLKSFSRERLGLAVAKRYFRLMPLAAVSTMAAYLLITAGPASLLGEYATVTNFPVVGLLRDPASGGSGLAEAWVSAILLRSDYNVPLWTVSMELVGSLALFGIIAVTSGLQRRHLVWWALFGIFALITRQYYMADFMAGLLLADYLLRHEGKKTGSLSAGAATFLLVAAVLVGTLSPGWLTPLVGKVPHHIEAWLMIVSSIGFVTLAAFSPAAIRLLSMKPLVWLGERSFALYVIHAVVMQGVGQGLVIIGVRSGLSVPFAITIAIVVITLITLWLSDWLTRHVDLPSMALANKIGGWLAGKAIPAGSKPAVAERAGAAAAVREFQDTMLKT